MVAARSYNWIHRLLHATFAEHEARTLSRRGLR